LTDGQLVGIEGGGFLLERRSQDFRATSDANGEPFLGRPFVNALSGKENTAAISFPSDTAKIFGGLAGSTTVESGTRLWGAEINGAIGLLRECGLRADVLVGFRYLDLDETLRVTTAFTAIDAPLNPGFNGGPVLPGQSVTLFDGYHGRNQFYGGQLGARVSYQLGPISAEMVGKIALGSNEERVVIDGASTLYRGGLAPATVPGGDLVQLSNIGIQKHDIFTVVPEVGLNLGYQITPWMQARVGYTFLYVSDVVRPGNQIDRTVDPHLVPTFQDFIPGSTGVHPIPLFKQSDFSSVHQAASGSRPAACYTSPPFRPRLAFGLQPVKCRHLIQHRFHSTPPGIIG
jgi:hypothetical protein